MIALKTGQKVLIPRTGGGKTEGQIIAVIDWDHVLVEFPLGETYRGKQIPEEHRGRIGRKTLSIKELELI